MRVFLREMLHQNVCGWKTRVRQPRSGERMQPTAQAVGHAGETEKPQRGENSRSDVPVTAAVAFAEPELGCRSCLAGSPAKSASEVSAPVSSSLAASSEAPCRR